MRGYVDGAVLYIFCFHSQVDLRDKPALQQIFASTQWVLSLWENSQFYNLLNPTF